MNFASVSPLQPAKSFWRNRGLIFSLSQREVVARYRGTVVGVFWVLIQPLLMLTTYTFVFSVVFQARWGVETNYSNVNANVQYSLALFIGLFVFNVFSECVGRSPTLIVNNANFVKKVVFPLEILPWTVLGASLFQCGVSFCVWLAAHVLLIGLPPLTSWLFPLVVLPLIFFTLGLSWLLASLGVFLRDIGQATAIVTTVLFFMSPIFYPMSAVPEQFHIVYRLNPITYAVEQARAVLFFGEAPDPALWCLYLGLSLLILWLGFAWFQKTRRGFADVL